VTRRAAPGIQAKKATVMIIYGLRNCDSCRKARNVLSGAVLHDVRVQGMPDEILEAAFATFGPAIVNTRSATWRTLDAAERDMTPVELVRAYPAVMKRPLIDCAGRLYLGWTEDVRKALGG